jgi:response regulator NasT
MEAMGLSEPDAFARIQRMARDRNLRLADVAAGILDHEELLRARGRAG